jgi:hypothetical protein
MDGAIVLPLQFAPVRAESDLYSDRIRSPVIWSMLDGNRQTAEDFAAGPACSALPLQQ